MKCLSGLVPESKILLKDLIVKTENTWKVALKGIARDLDYKKLDKSIKVNEKTEAQINDWIDFNFNKPRNV